MATKLKESKNPEKRIVPKPNLKNTVIRGTTGTRETQRAGAGQLTTSKPMNTGKKETQRAGAGQLFTKKANTSGNRETQRTVDRLKKGFSLKR